MDTTRSVNEIKALILDTVRQANSGHTGGCLSSLDFTYVIYRDILNYDPDDPTWINRDRFILSAGHESTLLYSMLHLVGYLDMAELQRFRQLGSKTPGHPEAGLTPGVEATTGPLGQGVAMSVGMAVAEEHLRAQLGEDVISHYTYCLCSDGDLQEPVSLGAAELAAHWKLGKLIMFYDCNRVQISGQTDRADSTDVAAVFKGIGWEVLKIDGHDHGALKTAVAQGQATSDRPTLIIGETIMAHGVASMEGDYNTHGAPLPPEEIAASKTKWGLDPKQHFQLSDETVADFRHRQGALKELVAGWKAHVNERRKDQTFAASWKSYMDGPDLSQVEWPEFEPGAGVATRKAFGMALEAAAKAMPSLVGGSADLEPSNNTGGFAKAYGDFSAGNRGGRNFAYGVREFPMGAINNGMSMHGGLRPFGATFAVFSDYERPAVRLRALMKTPVISVYTHDSVFVGEDGPTHQPVEQIMALRVIPNLYVYRPADALETVLCMEEIMKDAAHPAAFMLTRQAVPVLDGKDHELARAGVPKGAYILKDCDGEPDVVVFAAGSEVHLALDAAEQLQDVAVRVVSVPCWERFFAQTGDYQRQVLGAEQSLKVSVEAGVTQGWERFTGRNGLTIGINRFGISAPWKEVAEHFGITADQVVQQIRQALEK